MLLEQERSSIYSLYKTGLSVTEISRKTGRSITTIYRLLENHNDSTSAKASINISKKVLKYKDYLTSQVRHGITNGRRLFSEIKKLGYQGSYSSLNRSLRNIGRTSQDRHSHRFETEPGEQAQVDWGSFGRIETNGEKERLYAFVYVLGWSRAMYAEFTFKQNLQTFQRCHINAFEKLGIPSTIVYDNVKTVVLGRERFSNGAIKINYNPAFLDFTTHYNFQVKLCPPYWPRAKGKVESGIKYLRNNFIQGMRFKKANFSLDYLNTQVSFWLDNIANNRIHGTTKEKPSIRWREEKQYLSFPNNFPTYTTSPFQERRSTKDGMVQYKSCFYSVPINFSRRKLLIREVSKKGVAVLEIYYSGKLITEHLISNERGNFIVRDDHLEKRASESIRSKVNLKLRRKIEKTEIVTTRGLNYYDEMVLGAKDGQIKN